MWEVYAGAHALVVFVAFVLFVCKRVCLSVHMSERMLIFLALLVVIHYSVSSFPWCLTATGTLCLEKMTSSSGRQYYLIPLFYPDGLSLLWTLTLAVKVCCMVFICICVCFSTFVHLPALSLFYVQNSFSAQSVRLFSTLCLLFSDAKLIEGLCLSITVIHKLHSHVSFDHPKVPSKSAFTRSYFAR